MNSLSNLVGQRLGQYQIIEQIGAGGMAAVFKAHQPGLKREVAIKVLPPYLAGEEDFSQRFAREAQAIGNLHHPNILPVYEAGQDQGYSFIAMRHVPGAITLPDYMAQPLTDQQIGQLIDHIAAALDHAHQAGIIHRDVKPSNVLMDGDWVLLSDFGMAKIMEENIQLTGTGVGMGTPAYMSPEQGLGERVDHRTDIYSLGIIAFEMLTGQIPHQAETPIATVMRRIKEPLPAPRAINPDLSESVEACLLKALANEPFDRYDSAGAFAAALQQAFQQPLQAAPAGQETISPTHPTEDPPPIHETARARLAADDEEIGPTQAPPVGLKSRSGAEIAIITILGLITFCAAMFGLLDLITVQNSGFTLGLAGLGQVAAGLSTIGMIWFRKRLQAASAMLTSGLISWFIGASILGIGLGVLALPTETPFWENFGFTTFFCFAPGGVLAVLGLALYIVDQRRSRALESPPPAHIQTNTATQDNRAEKLKRANDYLNHITKLIGRKKLPTFVGQTDSLTAMLKSWDRRFEQLVDRLNAFEANEIIQRDLQVVPQTIAHLKEQLARETDATLQAQMNETLASHEAHHSQLESLTHLMRRTELEIDETLATIGTIYSQLQLIGAKEIDSERAKRLSTDIEEEANKLEDLLVAMDEVYQENLY